MEKILSVIPNLCEGTNKEIIESIEQSLKAVKGLILLDISMDSTRNRTVFAFTGNADAIFQGGYYLYERAMKDIDMRNHKGEYPRIGALDVFPFVPVKDVTIEESVELSVRFAEEVVKRFNVPVYLFAESARFPIRKDIDHIRDCEYEGLEERMKEARWKPDLGPDRFNPDFGATIIGARHPLVSFKVHFDTKDVDVIRKICREIQQSSGGMTHVKSHAGRVPDTGLAEMTVSISNYSVTSPFKVLELVRIISFRYAMKITGVEMIGIIPEKVFIDAALHYMQITDFKTARILEKSITEHFK